MTTATTARSVTCDPLECMMMFHRSIRAALQTLDELADLADRGETDTLKASALYEFFSGPMRWHDIDERESLLKRLVRAVPDQFDGALVAAMEEHLSVEEVVDDVLAHLQDIAWRSSPPNARVLRAAAIELREILSEHLEREERDVFPRARAILTQRDLDEMMKEINARRLLRLATATTAREHRSF